MPYKRGLAPTLVLLLSLLTALPARPVRAQQAPACSASPNDKEVSSRLAWIEKRLARGTPYAATWWGGWLAFATVEGIWGWVKFAQTDDRLDRDTWLVTGLGSALWVPQLLIWPLRSAFAVRGVRRLPRGTPEERRGSLAKAEHTLERAAASERESTGWEEHVLDTAWTVGSTAYIFGRSWRASDSKQERHRVLEVSGIELAVSELVTEAAILSTPRKAVRDYEAYRAAGCDSRDSAPSGGPRAPSVASASSPKWNVDLGANRIVLKVVF